MSSIVALLLAVGLSTAIAPQEAVSSELAGGRDASPSGGWRHSAVVYLLAAGLDGEATVKGLDADVDVGFSDIWDHLEIGGMLAYRGESPRSAVMVDFIYMGLFGEKERGPVSSEVDVDELVVEVDGSWRLDERTELYGGLRYWNIDADVEVVGPITGSAGGREDWLDPLVGVRHSVPLSERLSLVARGDVGGFGVGSDFSWQALVRLNWELSSSVALTLGYRAVDVDYESGSGASEFRYDVLTSGLLFGIVFGL